MLIRFGVEKQKEKKKNKKRSFIYMFNNNRYIINYLFNSIYN